MIDYVLQVGKRASDEHWTERMSTGGLISMSVLGRLMISVSIVGASGYTGGETLRVVVRPPSSEGEPGDFRIQRREVCALGSIPTCAKRTDLKFVASADLRKADLLSCALPHGMAMGRIAEFLQLGERVIDLSSDFRLRECRRLSSSGSEHEHSNPEFLQKAVYGILNSAPGSDPKCPASDRALAAWLRRLSFRLYPLFKNGVC